MTTFTPFRRMFLLIPVFAATLSYAPANDPGDTLRPGEPLSNGLLQGIVNADALRRDFAWLQAEAFIARLEALPRKDPSYKSLKAQALKARNLYRQYRYYAIVTDQKIARLQASNPRLYHHICTLHTVSGRPVAAMIGVKQRQTPVEATGETFIKYASFTSHTEPVPFISRETEGGILLLPPMEFALKISLAIDGDLEDFRHELGHFDYAVQRSLDYFRYLSFLQQRGIPARGGHNHDDPSGRLAHQYERIRQDETLKE